MIQNFITKLSQHLFNKLSQQLSQNISQQTLQQTFATSLSPNYEQIFNIIYFNKLWYSSTSQLYHKIFRNILSQLRHKTFATTSSQNISQQTFATSHHILSQNISQQTFTLCIAIIFDEQLSHLNTFLFVNLSITSSQNWMH